MDKNILMYLGGDIRNAVSRVDMAALKDLMEIRIREGMPIILVTDKGEVMTDYRPTAKDISLTAEIMGGYSLYAFDEEMKNGFLTIEGGHRVGICGKTVIENGRIKTIRNITSLNIRIAREVKGCGDKAVDFIFDEAGVHNTLIISPPGGGKTTILRDVIRQVSNRGVTVGVCDERSEIGASFRGRVMNDLGIRCDVLDCCPKAEGIEMLLRSMSPRVIAVDEIGSERDFEAIKAAVNSGVKLFCTAHGKSIADVKKYEGIFERYILLFGADEAGKIKAVYDGEFREMR